MGKMDKIDYKIVSYLQQNARLSNQELSELVALSPSPCLRRVRHLEEKGDHQGLLCDCRSGGMWFTHNGVRINSA